MPYQYEADELARPAPDDVRAARIAAGLTQAAAAALVHRADSARWREWERTGPTGRTIDPAVWELYLLKSGLRTWPRPGHNPTNGSYKPTNGKK